MSKLMATVKRHTTAQESNGKDTLRLFALSARHMFGESGDWTPLAWLLAKSQPKQGQILRRLAGMVLNGFQMVKDDSQPSGLRIRPVKTENQGFDEELLSKIEAMVQKGVTIQSKDVAGLWEQEKVAEEFDPREWAAKIAKSAKYKAHIGAMIAALQAAQKAA